MLVDAIDSFTHYGRIHSFHAKHVLVSLLDTLLETALTATAGQPTDIHRVESTVRCCCHCRQTSLSLGQQPVAEHLSGTLQSTVHCYNDGRRRIASVRRVCASWHHTASTTGTTCSAGAVWQARGHGPAMVETSWTFLFAILVFVRSFDFDSF